MNINQLRYFVSVATYRSFTKAAERHFLTQTAITQQIRALEDSMNLKLINRQKRPIELTPAGNVFFQEAKQIIHRMDQAIEKAQEASTGAVGTIRIGYEKGYERSDLSDRLRIFHREYPNILFTCFRKDTDQLAAGLLSDELDIIFSWDSTNLRGGSDICSRLDMSSPLNVGLYANHPLATKKSLRREDLKDETLLFLTPSSVGESSGDAHFLELYEKAGFQPNFLLKGNDIESLLIMVAAEEGICIFPSYGVSKLTNADSLVFIPLEGENEKEDIYMMWKFTNHNQALECFVANFHSLD